MLRVSCNIPRRPFSVEANFDVADGEVFALFGPSGAGKTSILSTVAGFEQAATGYIEADGINWLDTRHTPSVFVPVWKRRLGYVEQSSRLFPHLTVRQNILYGLRGQPDRIVNTLIEQFDLAGVLDSRPHQLSGGQQQRVTLARALAPQPRLLLLDEPLASLDWLNRRGLQDLLHDVNQRLGVTMLLVTHQLSEAERLANRVAIMDSGRILQQGTVSDVVLHPVSWDVALRVGYTARLTLENGSTVGVHPDRVVIGTHPDRGPVITGAVSAEGLSDGRRVLTVDVYSPGRTSGPTTRIVVTAHPLDEVSVGASVELTLVDPPRW